MENLWRFYDDNLGISGVCIGDNKEDAKKNAEYYLSIQFDDIRDMQNMNVVVWKFTDDDDYRKDFPYAIAVSY